MSMLRIHPIIRLLSTALLVVTTFLTRSLIEVIIVYTTILLLVILSRVTLKHLRFVTYVSLPILLSLLILWGWIIDSHQIALSNTSGTEYALFLWMRIISWGGLLQFLFIPLVEEPSHLIDFLKHVGIKGSYGILVIASIVFLPEMRRRLTQIIDARRAQGHSLRGLKAIIELPTILLPLISSLIDSAIKRAEFWSHRGIMESDKSTGVECLYSSLQSVFLLILALMSLARVTIIK